VVKGLTFSQEFRWNISANMSQFSVVAQALVFIINEDPRKLGHLFLERACIVLDT